MKNFEKSEYTLKENLHLSAIFFLFGVSIMSLAPRTPDLKANLNTHKLSVESVKVDVGNQANSDSSSSGQQKAPEFKFDQNREQTRNFFSQFRDESNRGQFHEMPGIRAYRQNNGPEPLRPQPEERASSSRYTGANKGNGLNLVA